MVRIILLIYYDYSKQLKNYTNLFFLSFLTIYPILHDYFDSVKNEFPHSLLIIRLYNLSNPRRDLNFIQIENLRLLKKLTRDKNSM